MPLQVDAVYENGVLRPLQPLDLREHEHRELQDAEPAPGLEEVRRRLAKIPGSMAAEIIGERGER